MPLVDLRQPPARRPSVNSLLLSLWPQDLPSTSVNITCGLESFRQILSAFRAACRTSVNFCLLSVWLVILPSTFCADWTPSVNFCLLSVAGRPSVNFCQLWTVNISSSSVKLLWPGILPSTFFAAGRPFVPFRQLCVRPEVLLSTFHVAKRILCEVPSPFLVAGWSSEIFHQPPYNWETFRLPPSTFCASGRPYVNFWLFAVRQENLLRTESWRKVFWHHGKLMEFYGRCLGGKESWRKLIKGLLSTRNVEGIWWKIIRAQWM